MTADKTQGGGNKKITITVKQAKTLREVLYMGILWGQSLVDANVKNGKADLTKAAKMYRLIVTKLNSK